MSEQGGRIAELLAHPLVVLLVGAVVTGLLVPWITRRWQNQQKELEIKTELVSAMSETVMGIVLAVQFVHLRDRSQASGDEEVRERQKRFDEAFHTWEVDSAVIGTKLEAYFPGAAIPKSWTSFRKVVNDFYALEGVGDPSAVTYALEISGALRELLGQEQAGSEWVDLREGILQVKRDLIRAVLNTKIEAFGR